MSKLTKEEIDALYNKLMRSIKEVIDAKKKKLADTYNPSEEYKQILRYFERYDQLNIQENEIFREKMEIVDDINYIIHPLNTKQVTLIQLDSKDQRNYVLEEMMEYETGVKIPKMPDDLKDDIILSNLYPDFDVEEFFKYHLNKYKLYEK